MEKNSIQERDSCKARKELTVCSSYEVFGSLEDIQEQWRHLYDLPEYEGAQGIKSKKNQGLWQFFFKEKQHLGTA
jgi:hypothetical protein